MRFWGWCKAVFWVLVVLTIFLAGVGFGLCEFGCLTWICCCQAGFVILVDVFLMFLGW